MFKPKYNVLDYNDYVKTFKDLSIKNGKTLSSKDLRSRYNLPSDSWFIEHCPDKNVKTYNDFLIFIGLKPNRNLSQELTIEKIFQMQSKLNRPLMYDDFRNPSYNEVGIGQINKHFGTMNKMKEELGLVIIQENMIGKQRTLEELKHDINKLCKFIKETKNRKNVSHEDVDNCEWCVNSQTYNKYFKNELGITLGEYIKSIGFIPNESGMGMNYQFKDGEITKSKWEYIVSEYLKENNLKYQRNVKYTNFISNYEGNKDCDYVVRIKNKTWYVEIAGMLDYSKVNKNKLNKIHKEYLNGIKFKEKILKENNLNYKILYPHDLKKPLNEVFSFLD